MTTHLCIIHHSSGHRSEDTDTIVKTPLKSRSRLLILFLPRLLGAAAESAVAEKAAELQAPSMPRHERIGYAPSGRGIGRSVKFVIQADMLLNQWHTCFLSTKTGGCHGCDNRFRCRRCTS